MDKYLYKNGFAEIIEKKSRFIAYSIAVKKEEDVENNISKLRKKYWDARHHCYAYYINDTLQRFSDDGEPSRTAGLPILDVIRAKNINNCLVVVIRYFGGILLGTGGLIRAYTNSALAALDAATIIEVHNGVIMNITINYELYGKLEYILRQEKVFIKNIDFTSDVSIQIYIILEKIEVLIKLINELTSGVSKPKIIKETKFAIINNKVIEV